MKKIFLLLICISLNLYAHDYLVDYKQTHVLEIAKSLSNVGVLKMKSNGYIYLDISNEFITKTFPNLILDGHLRPTDSFGSEEGAHISVIGEREKCSGIESEIGKQFTFEVVELRTIPSTKMLVGGPPTRVHLGDRWILAVSSPELEELRKRYGLTPLLDQHDFHISIGFEVPFNRINNYGSTPKK